MEENINMLELLQRPAFYVRDGRIVRVNREAARYLIAEGTPVGDLIAAGREEYESFSGGCLCLTVQIEGVRFAADLVQQGDYHLFILEQETIDAQLQTMALVAQELRSPLTGMMTAADRLQRSAGADKEVAQLNRRLHQLLRLVGNMSDAARYADSQNAMEYLEISTFFDEIFQKSSSLAQESGKIIHFSGLTERIVTLADSQLLERAIYNLISNAMKYSPDGSTIEAKLTRFGKLLRFSITDAGCGIDAGIQGNLFGQYRRQPSLEDPRQGLGLGLLMVRLAAMAHGGTVLIDQPQAQGTRVTMTLAIRQDAHTTVRTPRLRIDYAGERDHALVELSDVLDPHLYEMK